MILAAVRVEATLFTPDLSYCLRTALFFSPLVTSFRSFGLKKKCADGQEHTKLLPPSPLFFNSYYENDYLFEVVQSDLVHSIFEIEYLLLSI